MGIQELENSGTTFSLIIGTLLVLFALFSFSFLVLFITNKTFKKGYNVRKMVMYSFLWMFLLAIVLFLTERFLYITF